MEHQTPSVFPGNFRKRKVLGTLCFPFCFPENLIQAKGRPQHAGPPRKDSEKWYDRYAKVLDEEGNDISHYAPPALKVFWAHTYHTLCASK